MTTHRQGRRPKTTRKLDSAEEAHREQTSHDIVAGMLQELEALAAEVRIRIEADESQPRLPRTADPVEKVERHWRNLRLKDLLWQLQIARKDASAGKTDVARRVIKVSRQVLGK
jgi:hypothetical protein